MQTNVYVEIIVNVVKIANVERIANAAPNFSVLRDFLTATNVQPTAHVTSSVSVVTIALVAKEKNIKKIKKKTKGVLDAVPVVCVGLVVHVGPIAGAALNLMDVVVRKEDAIAIMNVLAELIANVVLNLCLSLLVDVTVDANVGPTVNANLNASAVRNTEKKYVQNSIIRLAKLKTKTADVVQNVDVDLNAGVDQSADAMK